MSEKPTLQSLVESFTDAQKAAYEAEQAREKDGHQSIESSYYHGVGDAYGEALDELTDFIERTKE